jgi:hypothetical protein
MRPLLVASVSLPLVVLAAVAPSRASTHEPDAPLARAREVHRLQIRLDSVLSELDAREVGGLSDLQRARRGALLAVLRVYRDEGQFPHNYDFPGEAVPYFVDRETGVLCAVGYLLNASGRRDIVDRVAAMNNNVWVRELAGDEEFRSWLDTHGLTLAEAARIQAPYVGDPPPETRVARGPFPAMTSVALGTALATSYWNARPNAAGTSRVANALGVIAGAAALGAGASVVGDGGAAPAIGAASMVAGATSAWLSTRNVLRYRRIAEERRDATRATVAPIVPIDGSSGAGLMVTLKF